MLIDVSICITFPLPQPPLAATQAMMALDAGSTGSQSTGVFQGSVTVKRPSPTPPVPQVPLVDEDVLAAVVLPPVPAVVLGPVVAPPAPPALPVEVEVVVEEPDVEVEAEVPLPPEPPLPVAALLLPHAVTRRAARMAPESPGVRALSMRATLTRPERRGKGDVTPPRRGAAARATRPAPARCARR